MDCLVPAERARPSRRPQRAGAPICTTITITKMTQEMIGTGELRAPRLADVVAARIRNHILDGKLSDGERLPPLDTLVEQFRVSGPTMREAMRTLEAEGLIAVQRGMLGGALVRRPTPQTAAYMLALVLRSNGTQKGDVAEALSLLTPLAAILCARRRDRKRTLVRDLRKANTRARALIDADLREFNAAMIEFHALLLRECGNDTLQLLIGALGSVWRADVETWLTHVEEHGLIPGAAARVVDIEDHERVTDLIAAGDDLAAGEAMAKHLSSMRIYADGPNPSDPVDPQAVAR
jgi:GntR family transcriptional regulator, transcriptional repressor for pyruvate dehydrogenase complex